MTTKTMKRIFHGGLLGLTAFLVLFHLQLLWSRLADGSMLEPAVVARWLASAVLVAALVALKRAGVSLARGRSAVVFWLVVLCLHGVALAPGVDVVDLDRFGGSALLALPLGVVAVTAVWTLAALVPRGRAASTTLSRRACFTRAPLFRIESLALAATGPRAPPF